MRNGGCHPGQVSLAGHGERSSMDGEPLVPKRCQFHPLRKTCEPTCHSLRASQEFLTATTYVVRPPHCSIPRGARYTSRRELRSRSVRQTKFDELMCQDYSPVVS